MKIRLILLFCLLGLLVVACNTENEEPTATPEEVSQVDETPTEEPEEATAVPPTEEPTEAPPTATAEPTPEPEPAYVADYSENGCEFDFRLEDVLESNDVEAECGTLTVPEDRANPDNGRSVTLPVAVFKSTSDNPSPEPVIYLEGGPGGDAFAFLSFSFEDRIMPFLEDRDFIMFDQRGTGNAEPKLYCQNVVDLGDELLGQVLPDEEVSALYLDAYATCEQELLDEGIDLTQYNSAANAADVADLRVAMGYEEWHLYGISYGTRLAQTIMRDHPEGIKSVVLDSSYPLAADLPSGVAVSTIRAFNVLFDSCSADADCSTAFPTLEEDFFTLVDELNATPIEFTASDFLKGEQYDVVFTGDDLMGIVFQGLYSNEIFPLLPQTFADVAAGDYDNLSLILSNILTTNDAFSTGFYYSVQCNEEYVFSDPAEVQASSESDPMFAGYFSDWELGFELCDLWDSGTAAPEENQPVVSDLPTLVLAGDFDPITPPAWGEQVSNSLTNEQYLLIPFVGHGASVSDDCPLDITLAFLNDPTAEVDASCIADMEPVDYLIDGEAVDVEIILEPVTIDFGTVSIETNAPEGWEEIAPGTFTRGANALDQTLLQQVISPFPMDELAGLISDNFGSPLELTEEGFVDANGRSWNLYGGELEGFPLVLGLTELEDGTLLVLLVAEEAELEGFLTTIFFPVLDVITLP